MTTAGEARQCPQCGELSAAKAKFCFECGTKLDAVATVEVASLDEATVSGERRQVTVLFADLSGYTAYSERHDPEQVRALADDAARVMGDIVERHGGMVDKVIGDAVMAVFGAPVAHEDDPERAVRASVEMQDYFREHTERFARMPLSIGINSGEAMFAPVGADGRYTVIGDTVNTAARLQGAADKSTTIVGEPTYRATTAAIEYEEIEPIAAKNKAEPVRAWKVVGVAGDARRVVARRTSLIGRSAELDRVLELWDRARSESKPYACALLGPAGIGKSRLVEEIADRLGASALVLRGRCLSYGEGITYWPVAEMIRQTAGIGHDESIEVTAQKLNDLLEGLGTDNLDELRTIAGAVSNLLGVETTPRGTYLTRDISQGELHWGLRRLLELVARLQPVVLVVDDLHWAEPTLIELVEYLADEADAPLVMLGTARPEFKDLAPGLAVNRGNRRAIELGPLDGAGAERLAADLLGLEALPEGPVGDFLARAAGNPLFLEETVRMLADEGLLLPDGTLAEGATFEVPANLQALIGARLDRLPDHARGVALRASVVGDVFWSGAVASLDTVEGLAEALAELEARGVVRPVADSSIAGEDEWVFHHGLMREVAYGRLAKADRFGLHSRCADWVRSLPEGDDDLIEIVAHHLEQACLLSAEVAMAEAAPLAAAIDALKTAGEKAERREGTREAARFYERALAIAEGKYPESAAELRLRRGEKLTMLGDLDPAQAELAGAADDAGSLDRLDLRGRALLTLASIEQAIGKASEARDHLTESLRVAQLSGDPVLGVRSAVNWAAFNNWFDGSVDEPIAELERAIVDADKLNDPELRVLGRLHLGVLLANEGRFEAAERTYDEARKIGRLFGTVRFEALAVGLLANVKFYRGPREEALVLAHQALDWFDRAAHQHTEVQVLRTLAMLALAEGDATKAERWIDRAVPLAQPLGGWLLADVYRYQVLALIEQDRVEEAAEAVATSWDGLPDEDTYARSSVLLADATLKAAQGQRGAAAQGFDDALDVLAELSRTVDLADARLEYATALARFGEADAARLEFGAARAEYAAMGATAMVQDIDAILSGEKGLAAQAS